MSAAVGRPRRESRLEVVLRIRDDRGRIASDYTVCGHRVEVVNYFGDGTINDHGEMSLAQFNDEIQQIADKRRTSAHLPESSNG